MSSTSSSWRSGTILRQAVLAPHFRLVAPDVDVARIVVPRRDAMAPPQLPRDAPVLDVVHPLEVGLAPVLGDELDAPVLDCRDGRLGERLGAHVPLIRQQRLDDDAAAVAAGNHRRVVGDALEQALRLEVRDNALARLEAIEAAISCRCVVVEPRVEVEHADLRQAVALADFVVVEVVRRRDLHAARAELRVDVLVGDDRECVRFASGSTTSLPIKCR